MYLINGTVFPQLEKFMDKLNTTPNSIVKNWWNLKVNITKFVVALVNNQVNSKAKLEAMWSKDPDCKLFNVSAKWLMS